MITGKLYDRLKFLAQILLPALGTLYFAIAQTWGLGSGTEVVGTIMAVDLFLGTILGISQTNYNKAIEPGGTIFVAPDGQKTFNLHESTFDLPDLGAKQEVRFNVVKGEAPQVDDDPSVRK
jgi:hypothetical protein